MHVTRAGQDRGFLTFADEQQKRTRDRWDSGHHLRIISAVTWCNSGERSGVSIRLNSSRSRANSHIALVFPWVLVDPLGSEGVSEPQPASFVLVERRRQLRDADRPPHSPPPQCPRLPPQNGKAARRDRG